MVPKHTPSHPSVVYHALLLLPTHLNPASYPFLRVQLTGYFNLEFFFWFLTFIAAHDFFFPHFYCSAWFTLYLVFPFTFFLFLHLSVSLSVCLSFPSPSSTYPTVLNCKLFEATFWDLHEYLGRRAITFTLHWSCPWSLWVRRLPNKLWLSHLQAWLPPSLPLKHPDSP